MSLSENRLLATELAAILSDMPLEMLETVYQAAMKNYTDSTIPFGAPQLRAAWETIKADQLAVQAAESTQTLADEFATIKACAHEYVFIAREKSDPSTLLGVYECRICLRAKPVFNTLTRSELSLPQLEAACL